ncbi:Uncharacterized membrane protein YheB, UPF0754 family [Gracilibacillus orientalis]|uniref:Uncharacterized membrane protein YheB, UPF0754 family n=1 Tax=Gracilibacillus orientalis TaxID=334253 RepID=A0A1I4HED0_9BACI|nr:DUF445 family protein [Gracilibacillus orientalis]SFL40659.1 Uncharacterized membrane protein YheB, UPF0754 family [Gracilibacillus orientalis]
MEIFIKILILVVFGSFIGGLTNSIAIKMLFRPYEAKYIGKWKVPFTPGVIPKRRDQLAIQLGQLVVNHLLTIESIQLKLQDQGLKQQVQQKVNKEWETFLAQSTTISQLSKTFQLDLKPDHFKRMIADKIMEQLRNFLQKNQQKPINHWLGQTVTETELEKVSIFLQNKGIDLVNNEETRQKIEVVIKQYAESKGFLGNMVLSMFSSDELALKVQRLVIDYLRSEDGNSWIHQAVKKEWTNLLQQEVQFIEPLFEKKETQQLLLHLIEENMPVEEWLNKPIQEMVTPFTNQIKEKVLPFLVEQLFAKLLDSVPNMLQQLEVEKMVEKQVASFPTSRIEDIILSISRKEFKLITYLGALLGGVIGLIQAILFIVV